MFTLPGDGLPQELEQAAIIL